MDKKYPIGTKIRFLYRWADTNKIGTLVAISDFGNHIIYFPTGDRYLSRQGSLTLPNGIEFTWYCKWHEIEAVLLPNEQLLFSFMDE